MPYPVLFSWKLIKPEHGWLLGVHRTQDSGHWSEKEFHTYDMEAAGRQRAASGLVRMFMRTMTDWELESCPLLG